MLTDVQTCDRCEHVVCATCQPDAITRCADGVTIHCDACAVTCGACQDERAWEFRAEQQADIARFGP